jgi:predicted TIM-barrel fold metal-dependent hydrolase
MAEFEFVDTHVHFNDMKHPELVWVWLEPDFVHPHLGDIDQMKHLRYDADGLRAESRFAGTTKVVHIQAAIGSPDPVVETEWLQGIADRTGWPNGIVAYSNLKSPDVDAELERHCAFANTRGIRDFSEGDYLVDDAFHRGYALLEKYELVCDLDCMWEDMDKARDLARTFPNIPLILDHTGFPQERSDEYLENWKRGMSTLAEADNTFCKISGLGMKDPTWTVESLRPWVLHSIEAFGVERCFFGTNWPVDRLFSSYPDVVAAYRELVAGFSPAEQRALFVENAERVYRI